MFLLRPSLDTTHPHTSSPDVSLEIQLQDSSGSWMSSKIPQAQRGQKLTEEAPLGTLPQALCLVCLLHMAEARRLSGALEIAQFLELDGSMFKSWLCPQP